MSTTINGIIVELLNTTLKKKLNELKIKLYVKRITSNRKKFSVRFIGGIDIRSVLIDIHFGQMVRFQ